ncbi:hypothetical protein GGD38_007213 [Chitinophagaceae bacterium OAS944]|nr:hypothetical protein [Chitinophagaceae bacterium OAS944]
MLSFEQLKLVDNDQVCLPFAYLNLTHCLTLAYLTVTFCLPILYLKFTRCSYLLNPNNALTLPSLYLKGKQKVKNYPPKFRPPAAGGFNQQSETTLIGENLTAFFCIPA